MEDKGVLNIRPEEIEGVKERIMAAMEQVIDPELGIDIVNLGLVYEVHLEENGDCLINLTLTTVGCPLADVITGDIHKALASVPEVRNLDLKLVWFPAWTTDRMSRYARIALGVR